MAGTLQEVPNRASLEIDDGNPVAQAFEAANRPSSNGYAFDADGRMTDRPGGAGYLEWDSLGRLVRVRVSQGGAVVATYTYDALDRLRTVERGGSRIRFRYAGTTAAVSGVVDDVGGGVLRPRIWSRRTGSAVAWPVSRSRTYRLRHASPRPSSGSPSVVSATPA